MPIKQLTKVKACKQACMRLHTTDGRINPRRHNRLPLPRVHVTWERFSLYLGLCYVDGAPDTTGEPEREKKIADHRRGESAS